MFPVTQEHIDGIYDEWIRKAERYRLVKAAKAVARARRREKHPSWRFPPALKHKPLTPVKH